jgi:cell fate (sporulation/competence/biofilm development) regulator YlbF (YheA/YmcA/DUF963 family)
MSESDGRARVIQHADAFITALRATPVVQRFADAQRRFDTDPEVRALLETFQRLADGFQRAQRAGEARPDQVREIRDAQARIQAHPLVREFVDAREAVGRFLQETNLVISEVLGVDFGQTAGPAGGAC